MLLSPGRIKIFLLWLLINTVITVLVFSFIAINTDYPRLSLFLTVLIITNIISALCNIAGHSIGRIFKNKSSVAGLLVILSGAVCAALTGIFISHYIIKFLFGFPVFEPKAGYLFSTLLVAIIVTTIAVFFEGMKFRRNELEKNLEEIKLTKGQRSGHDSLSIKEDEMYHVIKCDDLIYLSSHGKKTTLHTSQRDYETNQLIKSIEKKLTENFIRIHKQFIINIKYLSQIKYYEGGRYMAYLNDDDESTLPVSRKIVPLLKEKLGI